MVKNEMDLNEVDTAIIRAILWDLRFHYIRIQQYIELMEDSVLHSITIR